MVTYPSARKCEEEALRNESVKLEMREMTSAWEEESSTVTTNASSFLENIEKYPERENEGKCVII